MSAEKEPPKVAKEMAEAEFDRWVESMGLGSRLDAANIDEEDKAKRDFLVGALMSGSLVVNPEGEFVFTPTASENKSPITFHEPTGASMKAGDAAKFGQNVGKLFKFLADCTHTSEARFSNMKSRDVKICIAIGTLF